MKLAICTVEAALGVVVILRSLLFLLTFGRISVKSEAGNVYSSAALESLTLLANCVNW